MSGLIRELKVDSKLLPKETVQRASKYIVLTGNDRVDYNSIVELELLRKVLNDGVSNDVGKYNLCESFKTRLQWQIDGRNLQNFLELRTNKDALWEIRDLAYAIYDNLPEEHKYLYTDYLYKEKEWKD